MARLSYPNAGEPRPAALPPAERTVGQLVAEATRFYGEHFARCLLIGVPPAVLAVVTAHVGRRLGLVLAPTLYGALLSMSYVAASILVLGRRPRAGRVALAWAVGWAVFAPVPFLVFAFVLPALAWLAAVGLVVPVLLVEPAGVRASLARAWRLARVDYVHALGSLATLAIVVFLTQTVLAFILRGAGGAAVDTAFVLANIVISPVLFVGAALLYVDQSARLEASPAKPSTPGRKTGRPSRAARLEASPVKQSTSGRKTGRRSRAARLEASPVKQSTSGRPSRPWVE